MSLLHKHRGLRNQRDQIGLVKSQIEVIMEEKTSLAEVITESLKKKQSVKFLMNDF